MLTTSRELHSSVCNGLHSAYSIRVELSHFTATITSTLLQRKAKVYSYVKDIFKTVPGLWAMVPADQFEDAKQFMQFDPINAQLSP